MKPTKRDGTKISYARTDHETCLYVLEALYEGVTSANVVELTRLFPDFPGMVEAGIRYEEPQKVSELDPDQHIGTLSYVMKKKRATCIEAAAIYAAQMRVEGVDAVVRLLSMEDAYGEIMPYSYHAVVDLGDGTMVDPSEDLPGYVPQVGGTERCNSVVTEYVGEPPGYPDDCLYSRRLG